MIKKLKSSDGNQSFVGDPCLPCSARVDGAKPMKREVWNWRKLCQIMVLRELNAGLRIDQ